MMAIKLFVLVFCLVANAAAQDDSQNNYTIRLLLSRFGKEHLAEAIDQKKAKLLYGYIHQPDTEYRSEIGILVNPGTESEEFVVVGELSHELPGQSDNYPYIHSVYYIADKYGYRVKVSTMILSILAAGAPPSNRLLINLAG